MTTRSPDPVTGQSTPTDGTIGDHASGPGDERENRQAEDGIVCGLSGWFTPHGVRYHEDIRSVSEIDPTNWSALLEHARSIDFFERPDLARLVRRALNDRQVITADTMNSDLTERLNAALRKSKADCACEGLVPWTKS